MMKIVSKLKYFPKRLNKSVKEKAKGVDIIMESNLEDEDVNKNVIHIKNCESFEYEGCK